MHRATWRTSCERSTLSGGDRGYTNGAILSVNAISAENGSLFFLEHFSNIRKGLEQAKQIVFVVSLEKIVKDREGALFQTKCMGMFGLESVVLDVGPKEIEQYDFDSLPFLSSNEDRKLHILILDNKLIIDELGYMPIDTQRSNLLLQIVSRRYEKGSIIPSTNKQFDRWGEMFGDDVIASAILDRLLHHCHIISTTGPSYRIKDKLQSIKQGARGDGLEMPDTGGEAYRADTDVS